MENVPYWEVSLAGYCKKGIHLKHVRVRLIAKNKEGILLFRVREELDIPQPQWWHAMVKQAAVYSLLS